MSLLTIFSTPKPFTDPHIATIQRNAIASWTQLGAECDVLLIGEEDGLPEAAEEYHVRVIKKVDRNESGTPLISSIFQIAEESSQSPFFVYVNADIILMNDMLQGLGKIIKSIKKSSDGLTESNKYEPFLLIGQRWDMEITQLLHFSKNWQEELRFEVRRYGRMHRPAGSDYFLFPRDAFSKLPDFAIGRAGWDNWMIYHAYSQGWKVIDGTKDIMIVHQNHDYRHLPNGKPHYNHKESQDNMDMGGGMKHMYMVLDANYQLSNGQLKKATLSLPRFIRKIERLIMPNTGNLRGFRGTSTRLFKKLRRKIE